MTPAAASAKRPRTSAKRALRGSCEAREPARKDGVNIGFSAASHHVDGVTTK